MRCVCWCGAVVDSLVLCLCVVWLVHVVLVRGVNAGLVVQVTLVVLDVCMMIRIPVRIKHVVVVMMA